MGSECKEEGINSYEPVLRIHKRSEANDRTDQRSAIGREAPCGSRREKVGEIKQDYGAGATG